MSSLTRVYVLVNRAAAIRRGINGTETPVMVDLDVATMREEDRAEVAARLALEPITRSYGPDWPGPRLEYRDPKTGKTDCRPMVVDDPSQEGVLAAFAAYRAEVAPHQEQERRDQEAGAVLCRRVEQWLQTATDEELYKHDLIMHRNQYHLCPAEPAGTSSRVREIAYHLLSREVIDAANQRVHAMKERVQAECEAETSAQREKKARERRDWIARYGSRRLQAMVHEGIGCERTYQQERQEHETRQFAARLASERPGWVEADPEDVDEDVEDVPESALAILAAGRQVSATCRLATYDDEYVCVDELDGRTIVWPQD